MGERTRGLILHALTFAAGGVVAMLIATAVQWVDFVSGPSEIILDLFLGLAAAIIVGLILNLQVSGDFQKKFRIVWHADRAKLDSIYENRGASLAALEEYARSKREEDIDILTIAGKNFFLSVLPLYRALFEQPLVRGAPHRFRILLLHPNSNAAVERSHRELPSDQRKLLDEFIKTKGDTASKQEIHDCAPYLERSNCRDVLLSLDELARACRQYQRKGFGRAPTRRPNGELDRTNTIPRIQVGLHYSTPSFQLIRVDERILVEQYHLGKDEGYADDTLDNCLARKVPVLEYVKLGAPGALFCSHFEYLWSRAELVIDDPESLPDLESLRQQFGNAERYVETLAALHIYGDRLNRFLCPPAPRRTTNP
jgi:hypothetical protein